ncbi:DUF5667 domain-containing protein [Amycolatopsis suaedae]|uniref:DUF5667 domain-containing protein n=1 Tax=Amycolatopsis suaedae TaxID=2510978 RepID=A0A4Q7JBE0_9PSEU|nr:DUF5667 domain-containing protein [Amycolatopsis suaedae]RZQ64302.1 hypothetical protein EWH70_10005 [Amycolatopsis suaedae]
MKSPRWSPRERAERERFARVVDSGMPDDEFSDELAVVAALRRLGAETVPDQAAVERMATAEPAEAPRPRVGAAVVAVAVLLLAAVGIGVTVAGTAVPGQPLYPVKLATETVSIGLTFDDRARADRRLTLAASRLDELRRLGPADAEAFRTGFAEFDAAVRTGVRALTAVSTSTDGRPLASLRTWADRQAARLAAIGPFVPAGAASAHRASQELVSRAGQRALALSDRMACYRITSGWSDDLGALPAAGTCADSPPSVKPVAVR